MYMSVILIPPPLSSSDQAQRTLASLDEVTSESEALHSMALNPALPQEARAQVMTALGELEARRSLLQHQVDGGYQ